MQNASPTTVNRVIADITTRFAGVGIDSARLDARILVAHVLDLDPGMLFARGDMDIAAHSAGLEKLVQRRLAHEPIARIIGHREFWGLDFLITPATLDPRADTETLVAAVLNRRPRFAAPRVLDLGTGSGCILLAILKDWPEASGIGVDLNPDAVEAAAENARRLGLASRASFYVGNWCDGLTEKFDIIVSNPPYIAAGEIPTLAAEVKDFDPMLALDGGADGLAAYRALIPAVAPVLAAAGLLFLEIGAGQDQAVTRLLLAKGFRLDAEHRDLAGIGRCLEAERA